MGACKRVPPGVSLRVSAKNTAEPAEIPLGGAKRFFFLEVPPVFPRRVPRISAEVLLKFSLAVSLRIPLRDSSGISQIFPRKFLEN